MKVSYGEKGMYDAYLIYKEDADNTLTLKEFRAVCETINKKIVRKCLEGRDVKLPYVNSISIRKFKAKYKQLDYNIFNTTGKIVYHENDHSNGWSLKWHWSKSKCRVKGRSFYSFKPCRAASRACASVAKVKSQLFPASVKIKY